MSDTKHTSTPWLVAGHLIVSESGTSIAEIRPLRAEANAEFIVRAVNAHDALLDACKAIHECIDNGMLVRDTKNDSDPGWVIKQLPLAQALQKLGAALQKAEELQ